MIKERENILTKICSMIDSDAGFVSKSNGKKYLFLFYAVGSFMMMLA